MACFCCAGDTCGGATNAVGVDRIRSQALGVLASGTLLALAAPRITPLLLLGALVAMATPIRAVSLGDALHSLLLVTDDAGDAVGLCQRKAYVPVWEHGDERRRQVQSSATLLRAMSARAVVSNNYARTLVRSEHVNEADRARLVRFSLNVPETAFGTRARLRIRRVHN